MQLKQLGDINFIANAIVGAVLFTLLFLTANTMMQSVRERTSELAVLKTLGFSDGKVLDAGADRSAAAVRVRRRRSASASRALAFNRRRCKQIFGDFTMPLIVIGDGRRRGAGARARQRLAAGLARAGS